MVFELSYVFLLSFLCSLFSVGKLILIINTRNKTSKLPRGPQNFPFIGCLHLLAGPDPPHRTLTRLAKKYGELMHLRLGEVDTIVASSSKTARELFKTNDLAISARPQLLVAEISCYGSTNVVFAPYGEYWRQLRKICTLELLSTKRVHSFRPIREEAVLGLCRWIELKQGTPINLTHRIAMTNNDIIARAALGKTSSDKAEFISIITESLKYFSGLHLFDAFPSIKLFRLVSPARREIERLHRLSDRIIGKIIDERKRAKAKSQKKYEDLLDVLLEIQGDGTQELSLTIENVKSVTAEMFGAGTETTSTVVDWAMVELLRNPTVLERAQTEVRQIFDVNNESSLDDLKYLKMVIKESLRLHPPTPLVPREARSQCKINGYEIPMGTRILINSFAIGRDPTRWLDSEDFKPERFMEKSVDFNGKSFDYIPFGSGRRVCPGITFGLASVELLLAVLLYYFDWALPAEVKAEDLEMGEVYGFTARRKKDLYVVPFVNRPIGGS